MKESCNEIRCLEQVYDPNNIMDVKDNAGYKKVVRINLIMLVKLSVLNLLGNRDIATKRYKVKISKMC